MAMKIDKKELGKLEARYPGIKGSIARFEKARIPACSHCKSKDTALAQCGIIGRTIYIAAATTKFKLIAKPSKKGKYFCNSCGKFF